MPTDVDFIFLCLSFPSLFSLKHCDLELQIVVLAGGTNDFHGAAPPLQQWISDNLDFMSEVSFPGPCTLGGLHIEEKF